MRVGIVRTDLGPGIYVADVENRSQRGFSMEPPGQSRNTRRPTDNELTATLNEVAFLSERGTDAGADADTSGGNNVLRIRQSATEAYAVITVTENANAAKTLLRNELNAGFKNNNLNFVAVLAGAGTDQIQIDSIAPNSGPSAFLDIDSIANGSTLTTALGFTDGVNLVGLTVAALQTAVYPTGTTIDVSEATIAALSTFSELTAAQQTTLADAVADDIAPQFVETGFALLSFVNGVMEKMVDPTFQPGGARVGLPAGVAAAIVEDDGTTTFTI